MNFCFAPRIHALLRRSHLASESVLEVDDLKLDLLQNRAERAGRRIALSTKEFSLLEYLMRNAGRQVSRAMIIEHVWSTTNDSTIVDVYINYLRKKVDPGHPRKLIHTVRGVGYELRGTLVSS
jgi:two-component system, OmpR family, copper resistance phosphate regulon response regulator CusR